MNVKQLYTLVNGATSEVLGKTDVLLEDLTNVVDLGNELFNAQAVDNYVKALVNRIGKVIFVDRKYSGGVPSVLMDAWEYGSVVQKISCELPDATENQTWELTNGQSYDPNIFYKPTISVKFFNNKTTFEIPVSITDVQIKQSFTSATELNAFVSMIYNAVDKSMTIKTDALIMDTIGNMIGETIYDEYEGAQLSTKSGVRAVNLLKLYNDHFNKSLTATDSITDADFIKYASYIMGLYSDRMTKISALFNCGGKDRFTPADKLHFVLLSDFAKSANVYLQSDTFHEEYTKLPKAETVPYWQGSGTDYGFTSTSKINLKTSADHTVEASGILGVMFDHEALGVTCLDKRTTTNYNAKAEFYNNWYKFDAGYFNDLNENFVVFFVA